MLTLTTTLYERLGGITGITRLVDDVVSFHLNNPLIKARYLPLTENPEHFARIRQHTINFFCAGSGGPQVYGGKGMVGAHKGMNVSEQEFIAVIDDVMEAMQKNKYGETEKRDVLAILYSMKSEIIHI
ncbi:group 1 truncated hemoglobin [Rhodocytophaga aerolata]|uniref:Group 1 truncated hemoglobin n=1 Tax=Rhodocytophaga aerolata TaxID=455078 RepID=A0ABT8R332_9BACT|nr:group 1 truncated hemoglobin [Rhodocytophaga aerolata]MDO1446505.1 group 1 truncated hemoglobin [Rhodocytophaga aerolata]